MSTGRLSAESTSASGPGGAGRIRLLWARTVGTCHLGDRPEAGVPVRDQGQVSGLSSFLSLVYRLAGICVLDFPF